MDVIGWFLLLIIAVCAVVLVLLIRKQRELQKELGEIDEEEYYESPAPVKLKSTMAVDSLGTPSQITIYRYNSMEKKKRCAVCDGENDMTAACCCICRQRLN